MKNFKHTVLLVVFVVGAASGCGSTKRATGLEPEANKAIVENVPAWYLNPPRVNSYIMAAATATSQSLQLARDKARNQACLGVAQEIETRYSALAKRFQEETGIGERAELLDQYTQAYKAVVNQVNLNLCRIREQKIVPEAGLYRIYTLAEMPIGEANAVLMEQLRANEKGFVRLRATEVFKELEREIQRIEERKQKAN